MREKIDTGFLEYLAAAIRNIYDDNLDSVVLYGSVARGDWTEESDIDIALLVQKDDSAMYDRLLDIVTQYDLKYNVVIAPVLIEVERYEKWKNVLPFYKNIENEGIRLWTAA